MKIFIVLLVLTFAACDVCFAEAGINDARQKEIEHAEASSRAYAAAVKLAENYDPAGFLKLYEIATDDTRFTEEYSEIAYDELSLLLYSNTELWIKTFSRLDQKNFRKLFNGVNDSQFSEGDSSEKQFVEGIVENLKAIKGDQKEMELVDYVLGLFGHKRN